MYNKVLRSDCDNLHRMHASESTVGSGTESFDSNKKWKKYWLFSCSTPS
jgi:hypothetical protein